MTDLQCRISLGPVTIQDNILSYCNGESKTLDVHSAVWITGSSTTNRISVNNSAVTVVLFDVDISSSSPMGCERSSVSLWISGSNEIVSSSPDKAGIECASWSNLTFTSFEDGFLTVTGGLNSAGIGTSQNGFCDEIVIVNGSYLISGGTGIGAGSASSLSSAVNLIVIYDGNINAKGLKNGPFNSFGSGIGSGCAVFSGNSTVSNVTIFGGSVTAISEGNGAGIGTGYSDGSGTSIVGDITIFDGIITARSQEDTGIGAGESYGASSTSIVSNIAIFNGSINASSGARGAGIGTGRVLQRVHQRLGTSRFSGALSMQRVRITVLASERERLRSRKQHGGCESHDFGRFYQGNGSPSRRRHRNRGEPRFRRRYDR
jgi:hypothetical protein